MRQKEHQNALKNCNLAYATSRHASEMHPESEPLFTFHFVESYMSSLQRQIMEGIYIEESECQIPLNGKGEWGCNIVPRANFESQESQFKLNRNPRNNNVAKKQQKPRDGNLTDNGKNGIQTSNNKRKRMESEDWQQDCSNTSGNIIRNDSPLSNLGAIPKQPKQPLEKDSSEGMVCSDKTLSARTVVPKKMVQQRINFVRNMNPNSGEHFDKLTSSKLKVKDEKVNS